jgi:hypothetical protein
MNSIPFPGANIKIGADQTDTYNVLHAMLIPGPEGELIICFELSDEDIAEIVKSRKIYYHRLTFDNRCRACGSGLLFQPMKLTTDLSNGIELE